MKVFEKDGYIICYGDGAGGREISQLERDSMLDAIKNKPAATETTDYRLKTDLTWEEYTIDPPDPDPEIDDAEVYDILFGGVE